MYGIIGYPLLTTFSPDYFREKFRALQLDDTYEKFPLEKIGDLVPLLERYPGLKGLNVTLPYKQTVIPFLHELDDTARKIGAVNTIHIGSDRRLTGYNTDVTGFRNSLMPLLQPHHNQALILGTGGASKAVAYALQQLRLPFRLVSRADGPGSLSYSELSPGLIGEYTLIINTTPLGMRPYEGMAPELPYEALGSRHLLYDLVYTPPETPFLREGKMRGAAIKNGYDMLTGQAEASWEIWSRPLGR